MDNPISHAGEWIPGDFVDQVAHEISCNPDSEFTKLAVKWYNSLYSELLDVVTLCEESEPTNPRVTYNFRNTRDYLKTRNQRYVTRWLERLARWNDRR